MAGGCRRGQWQHESEVYHDQLVRIFIDVEDTSDNRLFFIGFKERLKARFQQIEIWLTSPRLTSCSYAASKLLGRPLARVVQPPPCKKS